MKLQINIVEFEVLYGVDSILLLYHFKNLELAIARYYR